MAVPVSDWIKIGQKLEVTVWLSQGGNDEEIVFPSYVKDWDPAQDLALIDPPPPAQDKLIRALLPPGTVVGMVSDSPNGRAILYPALHRYQEGRLQGYWLKVSNKIQREIIQRRRHARVAVMMPLEAELLDSKTRLPKSGAMRGKTHDLSGGGVRFASPQPYSVGYELRLKLTLQSGPITLIGRVVYTAVNPNRFATAGDRFITAVQFTELSPTQERLLVNECFRRELESRQRETRQQ